MSVLTCAALLVALAPSWSAAAGGPASAFPVLPQHVLSVYVPKSRPTALYLKLATGPDRRILTVASLPETSREGFGIEAQAFASAALAPNRERVAFATLGLVHGMVGLLSLRTGQIRELLFLFGGHAEQITWSPSGQYIALTDHGPRGLRGVGVHDAQTGREPAGLSNLLRRRFFDRDLETFNPAWTAGGTSVRFSSRREGSSGRADRWEVRLDGSGLRRVRT